jgi:hypothetical protein
VVWNQPSKKMLFMLSMAFEDLVRTIFCISKYDLDIT